MKKMHMIALFWPQTALIWMLRIESFKGAEKEDGATDQGMFWHNEQFSLDACTLVENLITNEAE